MKLSDVSVYFDRTNVTDPDSGTFLFKGQVDPYDDSKRDANAAYRRILSVKPGTAMPTGRAVALLGKNWLVGSMEPDGQADIHREKYVLQLAPAKLKISRLSGFLAGTVVSTVYHAVGWSKSAKQLEVSSNTPNLLEVTLASGTDVRVQDVVWGTGYAYLVLGVHQQASGYTAAECLELDQVAPVLASLATRAYVPSTGLYTTSATASVNALKVRWQSLFQYGSQMAERYQEGDVALVLPAGTTVTSSAKVTLSGVVYQTLAVLDIAGAVVLHSRVA